ncbi:MAG: type II secretion system F family protein, partial [Gammaproteobacteria bacterium]
QMEGFIPLSVELDKTSVFFGFRLAGNGQRLSQKEILLLTDELATLLSAGLPLDKSLSILMELTAENAKLSQLVNRVLEKIKAGISLAEALENQTGVFSKFYLNMIRAGELGGSLSDVLQRLAEYLERSQELKSTVSTALIYPAILLFMSMASLFVMLTFVVPQFSEMFESAGKELPVPTQIVVALAAFLQAYWWAILLVVLVCISTLKVQMANPVSKKVWDQRVLKMPLFGNLIINMETAHLTRTLGTLLGNGVSILVALGITRETVSNSVIADELQEAELQLKQGNNMSEVMMQSAVLPRMAMQMMKMGEETGKLEVMLLRIAIIYDKQLRTSIERMLAVLEPALIISLGLMIAGIIVSILLAILSVNDLAF